MASRKNLKGRIDKCLDGYNMCVVMETHFTKHTREKLTMMLLNIKTMFLKSKKKTKDKQSVIPEFLENVDNVIDLVNSMEKLPNMVKMDLSLLNERKCRCVSPNERAVDLKLMDKDRELLKLKEKLAKYEQHKESLASKLQQSEIRNKIAVATKEAYAKDKKKLEDELWALKEQVKNKDLKAKDIHESGENRDYR